MIEHIVLNLSAFRDFSFELNHNALRGFVGEQASVKHSGFLDMEPTAKYARNGSSKFLVNVNVNVSFVPYHKSDTRV